MISLPPYVTRDEIQERLPLIFPEGTTNRNYLIREMAASTIFSFLYIGAVDGTGVCGSPRHVYRMTAEQAILSDDASRLEYLANSSKKNFHPVGKRWYADNTREPIRDETLREGLVNIGAILELGGIATTSSQPRYYLKRDFASLFNPDLSGNALTEALNLWHGNNLSKSAQARVSLAAYIRRNDSSYVMVTLPTGEVRRITAGPSSIISKSVIEEFASVFLKEPALLWLSTSDDKISDDKIASLIGLKIEADKNLPDIILVDLAPRDPLIVFVEVVATDGAINARRQEALYQITDNAGFKRNQVLFVTAYSDRQSNGFSKTIKGLAWNSFVWFASEPDKLVHWRSEPILLSQLMT